MKEAMFYKKTDKLVQCRLCAHMCKIPLDKTGFCRVRKNINGKLFSLVYGKACSLAVDPIEKKPLFHFAPGSQTLSIATVGCNFRCDFCQNWQISQPEDITGEDIQPERLKEMINDYPGFSWTYTEPTVFYEYFYDTAKLCRNMDKYHVWVTNGYTSPEPIKKASEFLNAVNVDYKGGEDFYKKTCSTHLEPVQAALKQYKKLGIWVEITNLLIPGHNDQDKTVKEMVDWIADNLGQVPLHFSRFFPHHKLRADVTTIRSLERAAKIADERLDYVYIGNIMHNRANTYCHNCKALLIERGGFSLARIDLKKKGKDYHCPECLAKIPLAGMKWSPSGRKDS
jgi:pyruvate formate lyase activating enzyme